MRLYVSGQMSGLPDMNFPAFNLAASQLRSSGYDVVNPADSGLIDGWAWSDYLRYDIRELLKCDGVATLDRWFLSRGARLEVHVADELGIRVAPVSWWLKRAVRYDALIGRA